MKTIDSKVFGPVRGSNGICYRLYELKYHRLITAEEYIWLKRRIITLAKQMGIFSGNGVYPIQCPQNNNNNNPESAYSEALGDINVLWGAGSPYGRRRTKLFRRLESLARRKGIHRNIKLRAKVNRHGRG